MAGGGIEGGGGEGDGGDGEGEGGGNGGGGVGGGGVGGGGVGGGGVGGGGVGGGGVGGGGVGGGGVGGGGAGGGGVGGGGDGGGCEGGSGSGGGEGGTGGGGRAGGGGGSGHSVPKPSHQKPHCTRASIIGTWLMAFMPVDDSTLPTLLGCIRNGDSNADDHAVTAVAAMMRPVPVSPTNLNIGAHETGASSVGASATYCVSIAVVAIVVENASHHGKMQSRNPKNPMKLHLYMYVHVPA